jgi:hypothetical protein
MWNVNCNVLTLMEVFINQKRINSKQTVKMAPHDSLSKSRQKEKNEERNGGKIEWELFEVNIMAVSR